MGGSYRMGRGGISDHTHTSCQHVTSFTRASADGSAKLPSKPSAITIRAGFPDYWPKTWRIFIPSRSIQSCPCPQDCSVPYLHILSLTLTSSFYLDLMLFDNSNQTFCRRQTFLILSLRQIPECIQQFCTQPSHSHHRKTLPILHVRSCWPKVRKR